MTLLASRLERVRKIAVEPRLYHVHNTIQIVERNESGKACPISGSTKVRVIEEMPDVSVLIDRDAKRRVLRSSLSEVGKARYDRFVRENATPCDQWTPEDGAPFVDVHVTMKVPREHLEALLDTSHKVTYFSGGWRSGKTFMMDMRFIRHWMQRGGEGELFWLLGPDLKHAYRMACKIFLGRESTPPIAPLRRGIRDKRGNPLPWICEPLPMNYMTQQSWAFIDGSRVELHHGKKQGGSLEGESVQAVAIDEATRIADNGPFNVCLGRVMESGGPVDLASVPHDADASMWVYHDIVSAYASNPDSDGIKVVNMSAYHNPHIDPEEVRRTEERIADPQERRQKIWGEWDIHSVFAYRDVYSEEKHTRDHVGWSPEEWQCGPDITTEILRQCFRLNTAMDWIVGVDFNWDPQSRTMWKVFGFLERPDTWTLVAMDEIATKGDAEQAAKELAGRARGRYRGAGGVCDANGFVAGHRYSGKKSQTNDAHHYKVRGIALTSPIKRVAQGGAVKRTNPTIGDARTLVRNRLRAGKIILNAGKVPRLKHAIENAPNRPKTNRDAGSWIDREIYGLEDTMRYVVWRIFSKYFFATADNTQKQLQGPLFGARKPDEWRSKVVRFPGRNRG